MAVNKKKMTLEKTAAILGSIQGLMWTVLSITGVGFYYTVVFHAEQTHANRLSMALFWAVKSEDDITLNGIRLLIVNILYACLSIVWLLMSLILLCRMQKLTKALYINWGIMAIITCIYDAIVSGLLVSSYITYRDIYGILGFYATKNMVYQLLAYGILFSLAARGYVLWVINLILSIRMMIKAKNILKQPTQGVNLLGVTSEFSNIRDNNQQGYSNHGFGDSGQNIRHFNPQSSSHLIGSGVYQKPHLQEDPKVWNQGSNNNFHNSSPSPNPNYFFSSQQYSTSRNYPPVPPKPWKNPDPPPRSLYNLNNNRY